MASRSGTAGFRERIGIGAGSQPVQSRLRPGNGSLPVLSSYSTQPRAKRSARASTISPRACSGARRRAFRQLGFDQVPGLVGQTEVEELDPGRGGILETDDDDGWTGDGCVPEERLDAVGGDSSHRFAGLTSRCTIPASWTKASPAAICRPACTIHSIEGRGRSPSSRAGSGPAGAPSPDRRWSLPRSAPRRRNRSSRCCRAGPPPGPGLHSGTGHGLPHRHCPG